MATSVIYMEYSKLSGEQMRPRIDGEAGHKTLDFMHRLLAISPPDIMTIDWNRGLEYFLTGHAAMAYTWTVNRTFTFGRSDRHVASEGVRYGLVGIAAALVNYGVYSLCLLLWPPLWPVVAAAFGSGVAMVFSYLGYSRFVFGK